MSSFDFGGSSFKFSENSQSYVNFLHFGESTLLKNRKQTINSVEL